jgi:MFS transporter, UMF1 family
MSTAAPIPRPSVDRRGVLGWMLFDWANQPFQTLIVTFVFAPYFAAAVASDPVSGQAIWGTAAALAGLTVALLAAPLGAIADRTGARKRWVLAFSIPYVIGCVGLWTAVPGMPDPLVPLIFFVLAYVGSEFTLIFTNSMLPDLGPQDEIGRISGSGWALGYLGGLAALVLMLGFIAPVPGSDRTLFGLLPAFGLDPAQGEPSRASGPVSALWYVVFAAPLFLFTPDTPRRSAGPGVVRAGLRDIVATFRTIRLHRSLMAFLGASMFYRDALNSLFIFGGIYAAGVLGWGLFQLGLFGILAAATGALGAWLGGRADRAFGPRPVIVTAIWILIAVCLITLSTSRSSVLFLPVEAGSRLPDIVFLIAGALLGAMAGALQAASRTLLVHQAEGHVDHGQAFGFYALSGKATSLMGPTLVATATTVFDSQRVGISPVILLFLVGLILLYWVKTEAAEPGPQAA